MNIHKYATVPLVHVYGLFIQTIDPNAYRAKDKWTTLVDALLKQGYRWVRNVDDQAVFELVVTSEDVSMQMIIDCHQTEMGYANARITELDYELSIYRPLARCPKCQSKNLVADKGDPGSRDDPPIPPCFGCEDCGWQLGEEV